MDYLGVCDRCGKIYWSKVRHDFMCTPCFVAAVQALQHDNELKQVTR